VLEKITGQLRQLSGTQISLVVGGGNFWRGRTAKNKFFLNRSRSDQIGMLGTVMNGIYLSEYFKRAGLPAYVMTPFAVGAFTQIFSREDALRLMAEGAVVIHTGGTGHPYFSTDTAAALRAAELDADCVFYAKNVDGVYEADPREKPEARKYRRVSYQIMIDRGLKAIDTAAMAISQEAGVDSYVFGLEEENSIPRAFAAFSQPVGAGVNNIGTKITTACEEDFYV
jgi:uridylate kinase